MPGAEVVEALEHSLRLSDEGDPMPGPDDDPDALASADHEPAAQALEPGPAGPPADGGDDATTTSTHAGDEASDEEIDDVDLTDLARPQPWETDDLDGDGGADA